MPAIVIAAVFTQALWWSRFGRKAGRPPVTVSRSAAVGRPPGKADMVQPPPSTQAPGGSDAQYSATSVQALVPGAQPDQVAAQALQPAADRVHVRVAERGQRQPPAQIDDPGPPPGQLPYLVVAAHGLDDPVPDREGLDEPGRVRRRPDLAAGQHQVGLVAAHRPSLAHRGRL